MQDSPIMMDSSPSIGESLLRRTNQALSSESDGYLEECRAILLKPHENRVNSENIKLFKLTEKCEFLKQMCQKLGGDSVKGLLKNAKIEKVEKGQIIIEQDQKINYMVVVLDGKLAAEKSSLVFMDQLDKEKPSMGSDEFFEKLTLFAKNQRDNIKKHSKIIRKSSVPISEYDFVPPVMSFEDYQYSCSNVEDYIPTNSEYGGRKILEDKFNKKRVFAFEDSTILVFEMEFLFYWLEQSFKAKITRMKKMIKNFLCFQNLQDEKLAEIILNLKLQKKKKHDAVYCQGQDPKHLYILQEGSIKITKNTQLFQQNPNNFYMDRRKLTKNQANLPKSLRKEEDVLPYANLTSMFNYRPMKKTIEIGLLSSVCIFGEEEAALSKNRQTSAHVETTDASYYQIEFAKVLEVVGSKNVEAFKKLLVSSMSKKILYRQEDYSHKIDFLNRQNLNYFYLNEQNQSKRSPRTFVLSKINDRMIPKTSRESDNEIKPFYTTFNFNKLRNVRNSLTMDTKRKKTDDSENESQRYKLDPQEQKILGNTHSWKPIKTKVEQELHLSLKMSPFKQSINIEAPLIDQIFLKEATKTSLRIDRESRKKKLSLGMKRHV